MEFSVKDTIQNEFENLFPAERKVANCIIDNLDEVVNMNVSDLAKLSNTSDATVVRTIKHLGYEGYYQMRLMLSKDMGKSEIMDNTSDAYSAIQKFFALEAERINRLASTIDLSQLIDVARTILDSNYTHIIAVGNTTPVTSDLGFRLERLGIRCDYSHLYEQYINHITLGAEDDCVIAISRSGASKQVIRAIDLAVSKKMKIIVITGELTDAMAGKADYVLKINEMKNLTSSLYRPDSHLQEIAINDALLYVIKSIRAANEADDDSGKDIIGNMISEFKQ